MLLNHFLQEIPENILHLAVVKTKDRIKNKNGGNKRHLQDDKDTGINRGND